MIKKSVHPILLFIFVVPFIFSCANTRKAIYFDINKDSIAAITYPNTEPLIQKNDILSISVTSLSPEASLLYNSPNRGGSATEDALGGYLVNKDGFILFPVIGLLKAEGFTKDQLQEEIAKKLKEKELLRDPIVVIRNVNYKVTVLGEVAKPMVVNVPSEKITILEAVGFAGDMTIYSNRSNVLLIREENKQRTFKILDLNSNDIFNSPYFYLKPNDIVYVKPNKSRISSASTTRQWLPAVLTGLSFVAVIFSRVFYR